MSYLLGWALVVAIGVALWLVLRKVGPPGAEGPDPAAGGRACCNNPPVAPGEKPPRRAVRR